METTLAGDPGRPQVDPDAHRRGDMQALFRHADVQTQPAA
jgi:hypothetical protein